MRRRIGALMMTLALLFSGCSGGQKAIDEAHGLQRELLRVTGCTMTAQVHADYGDRTQDFLLTYKLENDEGLVTVLEPELIKGLTIAVRGDELEMLFSGARLETGKLDPDGLTPVSALPVMLRSWREMPILSAGYEKYDGAKALLITFGPETEKPAHTLRFDAGSWKPLTAEAISDGKAVITCDFTEFQITAYE